MFYCTLIVHFVGYNMHYKKMHSMNNLKFKGYCHSVFKVLILPVRASPYNSNKSTN
jgi:cephalosporin-C deacetylase-like acetyl esterase